LTRHNGYRQSGAILIQAAMAEKVAALALLLVGLSAFNPMPALARTPEMERLTHDGIVSGGTLALS
jgi:hypothetical protein